MGAAGGVFTTADSRVAELEARVAMLESALREMVAQNTRAEVDSTPAQFRALNGARRVLGRK